MKLFRTVSSDVIKECRCFFGITDTKLLIVKRKMKFLRKYCSSENGLCKPFADAATLERKMAVYRVVTFLHNYFVSTFVCLLVCLLLLLPTVGEKSCLKRNFQDKSKDSHATIQESG